MLKKGGSDLHLVAGDPPRIRLNGDLQTLRDQRLGQDQTREIIYEMMTRRALHQLEEKDGADFAYMIPGISRFRVNVFRHIGGLGSVMRAIPSKALTLEQLNMPNAVRSLCRVNNGLILVTGKTGSGKSTSLAAMLDDINSRIKGHILTIEDPIEFVHPRKACLVSQREVGVHSPSFAEALHSALREDPDVVLVGELRDLETMSIAVTAAEMGILVMATLHTNGAAATVDRIVNAFPSDKQAHVRTMLSTSLRGVISQQLIQRADKKRPRGGARDPDQHARHLEPDPPGQARPAREFHAKWRRARHAHHGLGRPGDVRQGHHQRQVGLRKGHQQAAFRAVQRPGLRPRPRGRCRSRMA